MRRAMVPMLLLAAVALSTGVVLPRLQPFEINSEPSDSKDQTSENSHSPLTECEILKKLFCKEANWMSENNQLKMWKILGDTVNDKQEGDNYNEYLNTFQGISEDDSLEDSLIRVPREFDRFQRRSESHNINSEQENVKDDVKRLGYYEKDPLPNIRMVYLRNRDILIDNDKSYHVYDTFIATVNPFDLLRVRLSCQYNNEIPRPSYYDVPPTEMDFDKQEERERLDKNEINPLMKDSTEKRYYDDAEAGQKEIPDTLVFNEERKSDVQKKLFSFWSRLQSLSHKGRQLPTRRHTFVYYGPDGARDGPLTAEIRASHLRPPGQPLRWG